MIQLLKMIEVAKRAAIEAGGKITDYFGDPIDWNKEWIEVIVSNGLIHQQILKTIKA